MSLTSATKLRLRLSKSTHRVASTSAAKPPWNQKNLSRKDAIKNAPATGVFLTASTSFHAQCTREGGWRESKEAYQIRLRGDDGTCAKTIPSFRAKTRIWELKLQELLGYFAGDFEVELSALEHHLQLGRI